MTIAEFRADPEKVADLRKLLSRPIAQEALLILKNNHPATRIVRSDISETFAAVKLGHAAGWSECLTNLESMAIHGDTGDIDNERLKEEE